MQDDNSFSVPPRSTLAQTCLCLFVPWVWHAPKFVRMLKIPYPSVIKEFDYGNTKILHTGKKKSWIAPHYVCLLSPGKAARIFRALHWDKKVIKTNLIYSWPATSWGNGRMATQSPWQHESQLSYTSSLLFWSLKLHCIIMMELFSFFIAAEIRKYECEVWMYFSLKWTIFTLCLWVVFYCKNNNNRLWFYFRIWEQNWSGLRRTWTNNKVQLTPVWLPSWRMDAQGTFCSALMVRWPLCILQNEGRLSPRTTCRTFSVPAIVVRWPASRSSS